MLILIGRKAGMRWNLIFNLEEIVCFGEPLGLVARSSTTNGSNLKRRSNEDKRPKPWKK
jgi:hypothetical protein